MITRRLASLFMLATLCLTGVEAASRTVAPSKGVLVLRMPYRSEADADDYLRQPQSIGLIGLEFQVCCTGVFAGTDRAGDLYMMDPVREDLWVLKRFDRKGRFAEAWNPFRADNGLSVAVTEDGYIWVSMTSIVQDRLDGLPILVYRRGMKSPVMDWRRKLPATIAAKMHEVLDAAGHPWKKRQDLPDSGFSTNDWQVCSLGSGGKQVALQLSATFLGAGQCAVGNVARTLWLLIPSDGREVTNAHMELDTGVSLAPDGTVWLRTHEWTDGKWSRAWYWPEGGDRGEPLIDRTLLPSPWPVDLTRGRLYGPRCQLDAKGNVYIQWKRDALAPRQQSLRVGKEHFVEGPLSIGGEQALTVLDKQRRLIAYLPWTSTVAERDYEWIKPIPDGSGFYRLQFCETEARIYFHKLPT